MLSSCKSTFLSRCAAGICLAVPAMLLALSACSSDNAARVAGAGANGSAGGVPSGDAASGGRAGSFAGGAASGAPSTGGGGGSSSGGAVDAGGKGQGGNAGSSVAADGSTGGAEASGATGQDAGTDRDRRLLPFEPGRTWTYAYQLEGAPCSFSQPTVTLTVSAKQDFPDHTTYDTNWYDCDPRPTYTFRQNPGGDTTWVEGIVDPRRMIADPVTEGATWDYATWTYVWHDAGTVTVKAGTFSECWRAEDTTTNDQYIVYCRGVGIVHEHRGVHADAELTTKNF